MARGKSSTGSAARAPTDDATATAAAPNGNGPAKTYRHKGEKRRNIPPAAIAAEGKVPAAPKLQYTYSPRLDPVLRFDSAGAPDKLPELLEKAKREPLTDAEARLLAEALRRHDPWLEWAGKREASGFAVDPVALHIHERVSTQAILKIAARRDVTRDLFADPQFDYHQAVQFYRHEMDWSNRLILGDSLQVMTSLAQREDLAGRVQMIYADPPYGIKFASNFQPEINRRDVKDKEQDLTREAEMVKAYRDTWRLGLHSYLSYLRDRLIAARHLLAETGSIFLQIGDENIHRARSLMDEVFGSENVVSIITFRTTTGLSEAFLDSSCAYLLWYARNKAKAEYTELYKPKGLTEDIGGRYRLVELPNFERRFLTSEERADETSLPSDARIYSNDNLTSQSGGETSAFPAEFQGINFRPGKGFWKTNESGMRRLMRAERLGSPTPNSLRYVRFLDDFPVARFSNVWSDTQTGAFTESKVFVVQTNTKIVERSLRAGASRKAWAGSGAAGAHRGLRQYRHRRDILSQH